MNCYWLSSADLGTGLTLPESSGSFGSQMETQSSGCIGGLSRQGSMGDQGEPDSLSGVTQNWVL